MDETNPWARLGRVPVPTEEEPTVDSISELLTLKDQLFELNKLVMGLQARIDMLERSNTELVDNVFSFMTREELGIVDVTPSPEEYAAAMTENEVVVIKSGFTAPPPEELEEIRDAEKDVVEPTGGPPSESTEEVVDEKEFGEEYSGALIMAKALSDHIDENGAILNNQAKRRVYTPNDIDPSANDKKRLKELIEEGGVDFKATKLDSFRTLYYKGEDAGEEYDKVYGPKGD